MKEMMTAAKDKINSVKDQIIHTPTESADAWKEHQQSVSKNSPNLYTVSNNPNEQALTGDGYSATNGIVSGNLADFRRTQYYNEDVDNGGKPLEVVEHEAPGLVLQPGEVPKQEQLVIESEKGQPVDKFLGSVNDPTINKDVSNKYLFTDEGPTQNDVKQVGVGDCYFWGAVLQILAHDPNKFKAMMKLNNGTVETTMYYRKGLSWVEDKISRPVGIGGLNSQFTRKFDGNECGVRLDPSKSVESAWNAVIDNSLCMITRTDYYKAALWANCLEQAYSDFSRAHGQYGLDLNLSKFTGAEEFEFGMPSTCMKMFYGDKTDLGMLYGAKNNKVSRPLVLSALISFKKGMEGTGAYTALCVRRTFGDPRDNSAHIYSVDNVSLCDKQGNPINFADNNTLLDDTSEYKNIDLSKSKILLRNPWNATNSAEGKYFEVTLEDFLKKKEWTHIYKNTVSSRTEDPDQAASAASSGELVE